MISCLNLNSLVNTAKSVKKVYDGKVRKKHLVESVKGIKDLDFFSG